MRSVDEFVLFDDVQYTRRDWRNRNRIKTARGPAWLTIPVNTRGQYLSPIKDITVSDGSWGAHHWRTLAANYARAPYLRQYAERFECLYLENQETRFSAINRRWLEALGEILGVRTRLSWSLDYDVVEGRTERLVSICRQAGADCYVSGPAARVYLDASCFRSAGIGYFSIRLRRLSGYDELFPPFDHFVSVIDLIFNQGPKAADFMRRQ